MLTLDVLGEEYWDEKKERFVFPKQFRLELEHSLVSLSKWEQKHKKPFLSMKQPSAEELMDYIRAMLLTPDVTDEMLAMLSESDFEQIASYINDPMTATWFSEGPKQKNQTEQFTSELIYYWMTAFNIPVHPAETWHLNRLFTLIRIANVKNSKPQKMNPNEARAQRERLNAERRAQLGTNG